VRMRRGIRGVGWLVLVCSALVGCSGRLLSIRNVEKAKRVLRFQKRMDDPDSEDQWLSLRLGLLPDSNMCPREKELEFAVAEVWHE
jgi:hypothetical protein